MTISFFHLILALVFASTVDYRLFSGIPGLPSITFTEILAYGVFCLYIGRAAFAETNIRQEIADVYVSGRVIFLYFAWGALAAVAGLLIRREAEVLEAYRSMLPGLAVYVLVVLFVDDLSKAYKVVAAFLAGMYLNLGLSLLQIATGGPRPVAVNDAFKIKMTYDGSFIDNAPTGLFNHPNGLALLLLPAAILLASLFLRKNLSVRMYLTLGGSLAVTWFVLINTYAKGAVAWAALGTILLLLMQRISRRTVFLGIFTAVAGIAAMVAYSLLKIADGPSSLVTMLSRLYLWWAALEIIRTDLFVMIFGNGIAPMADVSFKLGSLEYSNSHNGVINQALFYGVPALLLYIAIFTRSLRSGARSLLSGSGEGRTLGLFVMATLPALFGEYFFEPVSLNMTLQVHLFLFVALADIAGRFAPRQSN